MTAIAPSETGAQRSATYQPPPGGGANILCVGISHRTAPVALRERLALSETTVASVLARYGCGTEVRPGVSELVILSTCNRLEMYAAAGPDGYEVLLGLIEEQTGVSAAELLPAVYHYTGAEAVRHLCRTAAGLESMVIGEPQILGQVSSAFATGVAQRAAGHSLSVLFHGAIRAGRRARTETGINRNPATVSSLAVKLVDDTVRELRMAHVVVLGAGEMGELAVSAFHNRGVRDICVVSRTAEHASHLSSRFDARSAALEALPAELRQADVLITSTAAPHHVVSREMVRDAMIGRDRPLAIVDIGVPRDVDPAVRDLDNVRYWDLDDLERHVTNALAERVAEIPQVERVVEEEAGKCIAELRQLDVLPLIADLRSHMESVRQASIERLMRDMGHLGNGERAAIEAFSQSLVNRLFHEPMVRLRQEAQHGQSAGYALALRHLFGLGG